MGKWNITVKVDLKGRGIIEIDKSIADHIKWLNDNGYYTSGSCSGLLRDHNILYRNLTPNVAVVLFSLKKIKKEFHRPLVDAIRKINVCLTTFWESDGVMKRDNHKERHPTKIQIIFSKPNNIPYKYRHTNQQIQRYPDNIVLKKFDKLIELLRESEIGKLMDFSEYPRFEYCDLKDSAFRLMLKKSYIDKTLNKHSGVG